METRLAKTNRLKEIIRSRRFRDRNQDKPDDHHGDSFLEEVVVEKTSPQVDKQQVEVVKEEPKSEEPIKSSRETQEEQHDSLMNETLTKLQDMTVGEHRPRKDSALHEEVVKAEQPLEVQTNEVPLERDEGPLVVQSLVKTAFEVREKSPRMAFMDTRRRDDSKKNTLAVNLEFTSLEEALLNPRIQLLMMRNQGVIGLKNLPVPLNERDIPLSLLKHLDHKDDKDHSDSNQNSSQSLESRRENAVKLLENLRRNLSSPQDRMDRLQTVEDLVHEEESESVGFELLDFLTGNSRRRIRPLRPLRKERTNFVSAVDGQLENKSSKSVIIVNVMHAHNVPVRSFSEVTEAERVLTSDLLTDSYGRRRSSVFQEETLHQSGHLEQHDRSSRVNPFVEVVFGKEVARTSTAEGSHPTWNETLLLDLSRMMSNRSQPEDAKIYFNLFDEVILEPKTMTTATKDSIRKQDSVRSSDSLTGLSSMITVERRWLGSFGIPFSTLLHNNVTNRIEGTFQVEVPVTLMGVYEFDESTSDTKTSSQSVYKGSVNTRGNGRDSRTSRTSRGSNHSGSVNRRQASGEASGTVFPLEHECTLITLFVTIDPPVSVLTVDHYSIIKSIPSEEDDFMMTHIDSFEKTVRSDFPSRSISCLGVCLRDIKEQPRVILLTKLLTPLKPPDLEFSTQSYLDVKEIVKRISRFVSLIPSLPSSASTTIWLTCTSFLDFGVGSVCDHAVILCNYLLYLGKRCGIVVGHGLPEGSTCYVIQWEFSTVEHDILLWNSVSGVKYSVRDPFIPLTSIGCIIFPDNVYANIQGADHPNRVDFDMERQNLWKPLFGKKAIPGLSVRTLKTIQVSKVLNVLKVLRDLLDSFLPYLQTTVGSHELSSHG